jgi:CheY-like chemotaxis protein
MREHIKVLVVDDDMLAAKLFGHALRHLGFDVAVACDGMNAIAECESSHPDMSCYLT